MADVIRLKLMWDYYAFPLWGVATNDPQVVVDELPLSGKLRADLQAWSDEWTDTAVPGNGSTRQSWDRRGRELQRRVLDELGDGYEVGYFTSNGEVDWRQP